MVRVSYLPEAAILIPEMTMRAALLVWILLSGCGALAADEPQAPPPAADTLHPPSAGEPASESGKDESWWQAILRAAPECKSFSDGCRQCDTDFHCSGLPIACQPREFTCADPKP